MRKLKSNEFLGFCNAGGPEGQYDRFDFTGNMMCGQGGGPPEEDYEDEYEEVGEIPDDIFKTKIS